MSKCVNKWCNNEADGYMCLRCEDIYFDAVLESKTMSMKERGELITDDE